MPLAHDGQILGELHHGDDGASSNQGAGGPEEGVEDGRPVVDPPQDGAVGPLRRVHEAPDAVTGRQPLGDVVDQCAGGGLVPVALWSEEALRNP